MKPFVRISDLIDARVGILGLGVEGRAAVGALYDAQYRRDIVVLSDNAVHHAPPGVVVHTGDEAVGALDQLDVLIRSPGFPPHHPLRVAADIASLQQTTSTRLYLDEVRASGLPVLGITGSKGKSTTSTLVHLALGRAGLRSVLVGNIGVPGLACLQGVLDQRSISVVEMSSYQCDDLRDGGGPSTACLLELFPEHLDWHGSVERYYATKFRIGSSQREGDLFVCTEQAYHTLGEPAIPGRLLLVNTDAGLHFADGWFMRGADRLFSDEGFRALGAHNRRNAVAALALVESVGARPEHLREALLEFRGLPFRLEDEGLRGGNIRWINDSLSTAPEAVAAALEALTPNVQTLIVGGRERGYSPDKVLDAALTFRVRTLIALSESGRAIASRAMERDLELVVTYVPSLEEAVHTAARYTEPGFVCLFSPGAPSYDRYRSFRERGLHFRSLISALPSSSNGRHP